MNPWHRQPIFVCTSLLQILYILGCTESSNCDPCAAAVIVKVSNLAQLPPDFAIEAKALDQMGTPPISIDSVKGLFKIYGSPGRFLVTLKTSNSSQTFKDTLIVDKIETDGCTHNNTLNLELEVKISGNQIEDIILLNKLVDPTC